MKELMYFLEKGFEKEKELQHWIALGLAQAKTKL